jgi:hypothetical protein
VILSGDSVAITCQDFEQAIGIGIHLFTQAFYGHRASPFWLRGAIASWSNQTLAVNTVPIRAKALQVGTQYVSEDDYLAVLALEKSGFKGMRLIVDTGLLANGGRHLTRNWSRFQHPLRIVARLEDCTYPAGPNFADILWMADDEGRFGHLSGIMAQRFKASAHDPEEFVQSAWTRATFDQVETLVWACRQRTFETALPSRPITTGSAQEADQLTPPESSPASLVDEHPSSASDPPVVPPRRAE